MQQRKLSKPAAVLAWALVLASLGTAPPAFAYHTEDEQLTVQTANTLRDGEIHLGFWRLEYGIWDDFMIGTTTWPWALKTSNINAKYRFYQTKTLAFSARLGLYHLDFGDYAGDDAQAEAEAGGNEFPKLVIVPFEAASSWKFGEKWFLHNQFIYTTTKVSGELDSGEGVGGFDAGIALSTVQFVSTVEWRWTKVTALTFSARLLRNLDLSAAGALTVPLDPPANYTTVEIHGEADTDILEVENAYNVTGGFAWSWETFNLQLGLTYGNLIIPGVNIIVPVQIPMPDLAIFWRW